MIAIYLLINIFFYIVAKKYAKQDVRLIVSILSSFLTVVAISVGHSVLDLSRLNLDTEGVDILVILLLLIVPAIYHLILIVVNRKESIVLENNFLLLCLALSLNSVELRSFLILMYCTYSFNFRKTSIEIKTKYIPMGFCCIGMICDYQLYPIVYVCFVLWMFLFSLREINSIGEKQIFLLLITTISMTGYVNDGLTYSIITIYLIMNLLEQLIKENREIFLFSIHKWSLLSSFLINHKIRAKQYLQTILMNEKKIKPRKRHQAFGVTREIVYQQDLTIKLVLVLLVLLVGAVE